MKTEFEIALTDSLDGRLMKSQIEVEEADIEKNILVESKTSLAPAQCPEIP